MKKKEYLRANCPTVPPLGTGRGCDIPTLGGTEEPPGRGPGRPAGGGPAELGLAQGTSWGPCRHRAFAGAAMAVGYTCTARMLCLGLDTILGSQKHILKKTKQTKTNQKTPNPPHFFLVVHLNQYSWLLFSFARVWCKGESDSMWGISLSLWLVLVFPVTSKWSKHNWSQVIA